MKNILKSVAPFLLILASCSSTHDCCDWKGMNINSYQSSIDTSMNYLEDALEVFPNCYQDQYLHQQ